MSGTSLDGMDVALVDIKDNGLNLLYAHTFPFEPALRSDLQSLAESGQTHLQQLGQTDMMLGHAYAEAVKQCLIESELTADNITAIGCHGQTIFHAPDVAYPFTMQIGNANVLAAETNITTVADFRQRDMVLGGQGAPLVPAFHQALFAEPNHNRVIVNIGGISNITVLPASNDKPVFGFDTGPGNVLMDSWYQLHHEGMIDFDGKWAKQGKVNELLMSACLEDPYFLRAHPKSTGREYFNQYWLTSHLDRLNVHISAEDIQRTLVELTAVTISHAIKQSLNEPCEVFMCGGGAHNPVLMHSLSLHLSPYDVHTTEKIGLSADWVEACAFAWLAQQTMENRTGNLPAVTGASAETILGAVYPSNHAS
jgi:anhydro-N-acetylmuramic acid kinase